MRIRDLPAPVTASKADWLPGRNWLGFTPQGQKDDAVPRCQRNIVRQFAGGYVLERITLKFEEPHAAFANDPQVAKERAEHKNIKDRLVAVHLLRHVSRPLKSIIGESDFERLQNLWATDTRRNRWSVAFPIIESYEIVGKPHARDVFSKEIFNKIYKVQATGLRLLDDEARKAISELEIRPVDAINFWLAIEDEFDAATRLDIPKRIKFLIESDLSGCFEGEDTELTKKIKRRAAWLANKFAIERSRAGQLICDDCGFDPKKLSDMQDIKPRSCFDVHHTAPLAEGKRYTRVSDFSLLCPTCHRLAHLRLQRHASKST